MSEQQQETVEASPTNSNLPAVDALADKRRVFQSPERSAKAEDDDITPSYVRGYN